MDDSLNQIKAPVYGFYGGNDNRVTSTVDPTKEKMKAAGKTTSPWSTRARVTASCARASRNRLPTLLMRRM